MTPTVPPLPLRAVSVDVRHFKVLQPNFAVPYDAADFSVVLAPCPTCIFRQPAAAATMMTTTGSAGLLLMLLVLAATLM